MKSYIKIGIAVIVTAAVTFGVTSVFYASRQLTIGIGSTKSNALKAKLDTVNTYIDKNYLYSDIDYDKANDAAVKAYVEALEEPYTHYYTKSEFESYISKVEESYVGIGIVISADTENDRLVVISPIKDSPAYNAGIKSGDFITAV